jgi:hypothetical protein
MRVSEAALLSDMWPDAYSLLAAVSVKTALRLQAASRRAATTTSNKINSIKVYIKILLLTNAKC